MLPIQIHLLQRSTPGRGEKNDGLLAVQSQSASYSLFGPIRSVERRINPRITCFCEFASINSAKVIAIQQHPTGVFVGANQVCSLQKSPLHCTHAIDLALDIPTQGFQRRAMPSVEKTLTGPSDEVSAYTRVVDQILDGS